MLDIAAAVRESSANLVHDFANDDIMPCVCPEQVPHYHHWACFDSCYTVLSALLACPGSSYLTWLSQLLDPIPDICLKNIVPGIITV